VADNYSAVKKKLIPLLKCREGAESHRKLLFIVFLMNYEYLLSKKVNNKKLKNHEQQNYL